jgi:hypothetical protein
VPARVAVYATPDRLPEAEERRAAWADESAIAEQTDEDGDLAVRDVCYVFPFSTKGLFARKAGRRRSSKRRVAFFFSDAFGTASESGFCLSDASPGWFFFSSRGSFFFSRQSSPAKRTHAVMSDYYFGLEFLKAYPGVYTTVFPWLSERIRFPRRSRAGLLAIGAAVHGDERFRNLSSSESLTTGV